MDTGPRTAPDTAPDTGPDVTQAGCLSRQVLALVADKWTALVYYALEGGPRRFAELRRSVQGVTPKVLTSTLRAMERDGLVRRTVFDTVPPSVEYRLTPLGGSLGPPMRSLRAWAEGHLEEVAAARDDFDARATTDDRPEATAARRPNRNGWAPGR